MIRIGPAGWSYADWEGIVYPRPKPRGFHGLEFLSRHFNCMEINSSFYAMPRADHAERWVELVADLPDFRFISKLLGEFTHGVELEEEDFQRKVHAFCAGIEPLRRAGKLGAILIQFPVSFRDTPRSRARLENLTEVWEDIPLALELRHRSWFEPKHYDWFAQREVSLLDIDLPSAKDHPPKEVPRTGRLSYLRLHGRNANSWFDRDAGRDQRYDYLYAPSEIDELVEKTKRLSRESDETYVVTNNHFEGQAIANAFEIQAGLSGQSIAIPDSLVERYPHLLPITKPTGQQRLF